MVSLNEVGLLGLINLVVGLILFLFAEHIPRNPLFGVRIGYTFLSERIWVLTNKIAGGLLAVTGLITIFLSFLFPTSNIPYMFYSLALIISMGYVLFKAKAEAELEGLRTPEKPTVKPKPIVPPEHSLTRITISLLLLASIFALTIYYYPMLPEKIAVQFDSHGNPTTFTTKQKLYPYTILFGSPTITAIIIYILTWRYPIILYNPWVSIKKFRDIIIDLLLIIQVVQILSLIDFYHYNMNAQHIVGVHLTLIMVIIAIAYMIIRLLILALMKK